MIILKPVNFVRAVISVGMSYIFAQDAFQQMLILYIYINMITYAFQNAHNTLTEAGIFVLIVTIQQEYYAKPAV